MRRLLSKMRKLILKPFSVMGRGKNRYVGFGYFLRLRSLTIVGKGNSIELKSSLPSSVRIVIYGNNNHLVIDKNVNYKAGLIWIEDNECEIRVGQKTTIESATLSVAEDGSKIIIGEDCMISKDVRFATSDAHSIIDLSTGKRTNFAKDIILDMVQLLQDVQLLRMMFHLCQLQLELLQELSRTMCLGIGGVYNCEARINTSEVRDKKTIPIKEYLTNMSMLHFGSDEGAKMAATYHSIISTVKVQGRSAWDYFGFFC